MSERRKLLERGKSLLIVLLVLSALALLRHSVYYTSLQNRLTGTEDGTNAPVSSAGTGGEAATPQVCPTGIVIRGAEGSCFAAAYDKTAVASVFESFSAALGEALGSSLEPQAITREQWEQALRGETVTFDFSCAQPLALLSDWLGTAAGAAADYSARFLALSCGDNGVWLYFLHEEDGSFYRCATAVSATAVAGKMESYKKTNASFAFENGGLGALNPYTILLDEMPVLRQVNAAGAVDNGFDMEKLISLLGMNSYVMKQYTESDGTRVYVESGRTLRIGPDGVISCKSGATGQSGSGDLVSAVKTAWDFVRATIGASCGEGEVLFSAVETYGDGGYLVEFEYSVGGIAVALPGGEPAAAVTVKRGVVTQAQLFPRVFSYSGELCTVLPMRQAAAAAAAGGGSELRLLYVDSGVPTNCAWVRD